MLLHDADGRQVGAVDVVSVEAGHLRLAGWAEAGTGMLHIDGQSTPFAIGLRREDVAQARGIAPDVGFDLTVPLGQIHPDQLRRVGVEIHDIAGTDQSVARPLPLPGLRRARARIVARFALTLARLSPAGLGWMLTRAPRFRAQIKRGLNLHTHTVAQALDKSLFTPAPTPIAPPAGRVTIVMPIYNAFELLDEALARVETHTDMPWRMVLIEDGSTDVRVRPFLRDWAAATKTRADRVTLLENDGNKGFIRSVNRGFEQALTWGDPVILLNSDAFVPQGWASRLMRPLLGARDVATTTPMSNDAEIFTTPVICARADIPPRTVDAIDATARRLNGAVDLADAPTGVGFCMGMSIAYLKKLTALDTAFGRGYGEEVDWCQRARAIGGRHLGVPNLFVEHRGGQSFGSEEKLALVAANNAIISRRYPGYDAEVQRFIAADPMRSARMALGMAWAAAVTPEGTSVPVYLAHSMGGGAEHYLHDRIARDHLNHGLPAVVLRVGGPVRWQVELITPQGISAATMPDLDTVQDLLAPLTRRRLIYSCGVGDPDPLGLPGALLRLSAGGRHPVEILFHDFYPVSPAYTLLGADGQYRGTPTPDTVQADAAHSQRGADGRMRSLADWQAAWGALIAQADRLVTFSQDSAAHVRTAYPQAADRVVVAPHGLLAQVPALPVPGADRPRVVGVLGNIGYQKGAALLDDLGQTLRLRQGVELVVLGNVDPSYMPLRHVTVHGSYALADLPDLAARYGITDWLIPSIWPETFSYTTHEALATGLPVHAFGIGAQGEAVAKAAHGHSVGFAPDANLVNALAQHFRTHFEQSDTSST
ncbi:glycosyltransferase [uncultured Tateyamaria sp.]|uniref:glycosyltransferase n=1 Tax=Rhodobacterales TaxID=204455 RepID=UPI0026048423|nr:glycosyltransferase [uncultured Tateyamaria sp.]